MTRKITIWQMWDEHDPAESDSFYPTKAAVRRSARDDYGAKGPGKVGAAPDWLTWEAVKTEGLWEGTVSINARPIEIEMNREGICDALKRWPNR